MKHILLSTTLLAAGCSALAADGPEFKLSGFGTVGAVVTNTDEAQFTSSLRQNKGADKSPDIGVDSRLGIQGSAKFNNVFSAVGQVVESRYDGSDRPRVEWLYGQASPTDWVDVRAGRMVLPVFLVSDSRNVGYASHWLRAPGEVYAIFPVSSFDGLQAHAHTEWSGINLSLQVSAGKAKATLFSGGAAIDSKFDSIQSVNLVAERGDWKARLGRTQTKLTLTGLPFPFEDVKDVFTGVGLQYDNGKLRVMSEYMTRRQTGKGFDANAYYVSTGYRFGAFMPYATLSRFMPKGLFFAPRSGHTEALGLRWDAFKNVALKAQLESVSNNNLFMNGTPAFNAAQPKVKVLSLAADFVF